MKLIVEKENVEQVVELFLTTITGCPKWLSIWNYLEISPSKATVAFAGLDALITTLVEHDDHPEFNKTTLDELSEIAVRVGKIIRKKELAK